MANCRFLLVAASVAVACLGATTVAYGTLVNHWDFDEASGAGTATDSAGSLDAALLGNATFFIDAARPGQVLRLDGSGDYAYNAGEPFTTDGDHTVSAWVYHYDPGTLSQRWVSWGTGGARYFIGPNNNNISVGLGNTGAYYGATSEPLRNTWQYWTFVRSGNNASLYVDGNLVQTVTATAGSSISTSGEFRIGRQYSGNLEYLHGLIDDLAIWDEPLTQAQIQNAMNFGAENYLSGASPMATQLKLAYRETFYNDTGSDIADSNGTVTGWNMHYGNGTRDTNGVLSYATGQTPLVSAVNSNQGYGSDERGYFLPVNYNTSDYLFWTDEYTIEGELEAMQWSVRTSATGMHAAVRVGSDWYATVDELDVTVTNDAWETRYFDGLSTTQWYALDFIENTSLALDESASFLLPDGPITAFGAYFESTQRLRLDNFEVFTVPEPGHLAMIVAGAVLCMPWYWRRRNHRATKSP